jgi:hypothetical protein
MYLILIGHFVNVDIDSRPLATVVCHVGLETVTEGLDLTKRSIVRNHEISRFPPIVQVD